MAHFFQNTRHSIKIYWKRHEFRSFLLHTLSRPSVPLASRFTFFKNSKLFKSIPIDTYTYFFHNKKNKQPNHSIKGIPFDGMKLFVDLRVNKEKNPFTILLLLTKTDEPSLIKLPLRKDKEFASLNLHTCWCVLHQLNSPRHNRTFVPECYWRHWWSLP